MTRRLPAPLPHLIALAMLVLMFFCLTPLLQVVWVVAIMVSVV